MTRATTAGERASVAPSQSALRWAVVLAVEFTALVGYFALTSATVTEPRYLLYPFVWINAGVWAVARTSPSPQNHRHRLLGLAVAAGYFLVVMAVPGKVGLGVPAADPSLRVAWYAPGWGPLVAFVSPWVRLYLVPFEVVGYASLAYLVYANTLSLTRGTVSGALGIATCVGCTVPVVAPAVGLLGGPATALTTTAYRWSYDVGTALFLVTLGLLLASHRGSLPWR